jgi:hypothetical protein
MDQSKAEGKMNLNREIEKESQNDDAPPEKTPRKEKKGELGSREPKQTLNIAPPGGNGWGKEWSANKRLAEMLVNGDTHPEPTAPNSGKKQAQSKSDLNFDRMCMAFSSVDVETQEDSDDEAEKDKNQGAAVAALTQSRGWHTGPNDLKNPLPWIGPGWYIGEQGLEVDIRLLQAQHRRFTMADDFDPNSPENREHDARPNRVPDFLGWYIRMNGIPIRNHFGRLLTWDSDDDDGEGSD